MTKKRKRYPDLQQKLDRPWCYYCERDFDDLKILISHQKAKHFKCDRCGRRLNTAGGLNVHMTQVHKESLTHVENAIPGRQGLEIEIFGMEGVPGEVVDQHNQQVTEKHFAEEAERQRKTGNPAKGTLANGHAFAVKRARVHETIEEIEERSAKWREDRRNGVAIPTADEDKTETPPPAVQPFAPPPGVPAQSVSTFPPNGQFPPGQFPLPASGFPPQPFPSNLPPGSLPQRPGFPGQQPPPGFLPPNGAAQPPPGGDFSNSLDDLIADVKKDVAMLDNAATATAATADANGAAPAEKEKKKKGKDVKLVFFDESVSPEEKMAQLGRYVEFSRA